MDNNIPGHTLAPRPHILDLLGLTGFWNPVGPYFGGSLDVEGNWAQPEVTLMHEGRTLDLNLSLPDNATRMQ